MTLTLKQKFLLFLMKLWGRLPLAVIHLLGLIFGFLASLLHLKFCRVIRCNIRACYPKLSVKLQNQLIRQSIYHTCLRWAEFPYFWFGSATRALRQIISVSAEAEVKAIWQQQQKGLLLLTPHLGAWELLNLYFAQQGEFGVLYKEPSSVFAQYVLSLSRSRLGSAMQPATAAGIRQLYKMLKANKRVGLLPDHPPGDSGGVYVPFLAVQSANTATLANKIAMKTGAPVAFVYAQRVLFRGFRVRFFLVGQDFYHQDMTQAATNLNRYIAQCIEACPAQYEWSYRRFRHRQFDSDLDIYQD